MRLIISVLVSLAAVGVTQAQITISTENLDIPGYSARLRKIVDEQIINFRTVVEYKRWDRSRPDDAKPAEVGRRVAIHGKEMWISRNTILQGLNPPGADGKDFYVHIISPDVCYFLLSELSGGKYSVNGPYTAWSSPQQYSNAANLFASCMQLFQPQEVKEVLEVTDDEYEGRPTKRITIKSKYGVKTITHLDRTTYQHIYTEADKIYDWNYQGYLDGKSVSKTEYRTHDGRLWPTRHEGYYFKSDGKKRMLSESVFLEYAPYTPTADDLDVEKQFGVKLVPPEPRPDPATLKPPEAQPKSAPPPPPGNQTWMYGVACLVFVAVVVAVLFRYS